MALALAYELAANGASATLAIVVDYLGLPARLDPERGQVVVEIARPPVDVGG